MQKQYSESNCSDDKYSISSRAGRRLYHRINNNNIRVLNKSKLSNKSNQSIGSVALRRTELSNDKIYSREEEIIPINNSQIGASFDSGMDFQSPKQSVPLTPLMSNDNYRQRVRNSPSQRSLRSDSQKSSRFQPPFKKYNRNQIQKLLMLEAERNFVKGSYSKEIQSIKRQQRENRIRQQDSISSSRHKQDKRYTQVDHNLRSIRTIKSSDRSNIKLNSSRDNRQQRKYHLQSQQSNQIHKLSRKYKQIINPQAQKNQQGKKLYDYANIQQHYVGQSARKLNDQNSRYEDDRKQKSRNLHKYQSEKYLSTNESEMYTRRPQKKRTYHENWNQTYETKDQRKRNEQNHEGKYYDSNKSKRRLKANENSLLKYQKDTWVRDVQQKMAKGKNTINEKLYLQDKNTENKKMYGHGQNINYPNKNLRSSRDFDQKYRSDQRSSILQKRLKHDINNMPNIKIKQQTYGNLYGRDQDEQGMMNENILKKQSKSNRNNYASPDYHSPRNKQNNFRQNHEYYPYLNTPHNKNQSPQFNSPETQISETFDSLILSINSHVTSSSIGQANAIKSTFQKIDLHLRTLQMISDYAQEFKKMYEEMQDWEELVFLSFKKFWVERVKVLEYLKKFKKPKRHESERMAQKRSREPTNNKVPTNKNTGNSIPHLSNFQDPFADETLIENPFTIPFCKVTQEEAKRAVQSEEGSILLQKISKDNSKAYESLQELYNLVIAKSGQKINMLYCDNFSDDIFVMMLEEIEQLIPNLEQFKLFEATKVRLGKIVKAGILILYLNGKVIRNISEIITFDDCQKIGNKKKIKTFTTYDLYYEVFEKMVAE